MLTKDLLRYRIEAGVVQPMWLRTTPATVRAVEAVLAAHREHRDATRRELEEELQRVAAAARSSVMVRGLAKVLGDRCRFDDPESCGDLRRVVLAASARRLAAGGDAEPATHRAAVAAELGLAEDPAQGVYADLPHLARLRAVPEWSVERCIGEYNLALAQGLLLRSEGIEVELPAGDVAMQRRVLVAMRFQRLLGLAVADGGDELHLEVAGPGSVIDQGRRYGLQLANFLPALAACPRWRARAEIAEGRRRATLRLDHELGLPGRERSASWVPEELRELCARLRERCPEWDVSDEAVPLAVDDGELVIPDVEVKSEERRIVLIECFHRWHHAALARRLRQLRARADLPLVIGVDRALARRKQTAPLLEGEPFASRGFLFSGYPSPTAIRACVHTYLSAEKA